VVRAAAVGPASVVRPAPSVVAAARIGARRPDVVEREPGGDLRLLRCLHLDFWRIDLGAVLRLGGRRVVAAVMGGRPIPVPCVPSQVDVPEGDGL